MYESSDPNMRAVEDQRKVRAEMRKKIDELQARKNQLAKEVNEKEKNLRA